MRKFTSIVAILATFIVVLNGCGAEASVPAKVGVRNSTAANYAQIGYGVESRVIDDVATTTYVVVGLKEDNTIAYLHIDEFETALADDVIRPFSKKELGDAYRLGETSEYGEWSEQIEALENYITQKSMTLDDVLNIQMVEKDGKLYASQESDIGLITNLDLSTMMTALETADNNLIEVESMQITTGGHIKFSSINKTTELALGFEALNQYGEFEYFETETYVTGADTQGKVAMLEEDDAEYSKQMEAFEEYAIGRTISEVATIETYDTGDGVRTKVPTIDSDLGQQCKLDLGIYLKMMNDMPRNAK